MSNILTDEEKASCSSLASHFKRAAKYDRDGRNWNGWDGTIDTISIHCWNSPIATAQAACDYFETITRDASCNYAIGTDGTIGICVPEMYRSFCTSSNANDVRAVTIEVSCHSGGCQCAACKSEPNRQGKEGTYTVEEAPYVSLINLVADICRRNNIKKLVWSDKKEDRINRVNGCNLTVHRDYSLEGKTCPGLFLYNRQQAIANTVNDMLATGTIVYAGGVPGAGSLFSTYGYVSDIKVSLFDTSSTEKSISAYIKSQTAGFNYKEYKWTYKLIQLATNKITSQTITVNDDIEKTAGQLITVTNLTPNTAYSLEICGKKDDRTISTASRIICTKVICPYSVSDLHVSLVDNELLELYFRKPTSWGSYTDTSYTKGYRINFIVNGKVIKSTDTVTSSADGSIVVKSIPLNTFIEEAAINYNDTIQIGIQTWVKPNNMCTIFDKQATKGSNPIFFSSVLAQVDRIYVSVAAKTNSFQQAIIYNNNDN